MTDVKTIGISSSQPQQQSQQAQAQQQSQQQMIITTHDLPQQQNVQQPQQQHVQQPQQVQQQPQQVQQQQVQPQQQMQQQVQSQQQMQVQQQVQQQQQQQAPPQQSQQQQQNNGPHNVVPTQVQVQPQVATSMPQQQGVAVSMHQQQGVTGVSMPLSGQPGTTTITTMAAHPQAVQVIQQPMQSQAYHLQQLYNTQGTPLLMPGNLALHPAGINPSSIQINVAKMDLEQVLKNMNICVDPIVSPINNYRSLLFYPPKDLVLVITAGKPFQSAAQLTPHMLTTASTPGQSGGHPGAGGTKVQGFPAGYLPVPTSATPGAGQTLVFGQLGVLGSPQPPPSLQQQQQQQSANKQDQVQKYTTCTAGTPSGGRGGGMQFAPWQFAPQVWTAGLQQPTLLTAAPNQIFIRGPTQPDMFIQSPQPIQAHNALATQQQIQGVQQIATTSGKPKIIDIQQQQAQQGKPGVGGQRPLNILPSLQAANIRAASSVSTQTVHGVQATVQAQSGKGGSGSGKGRGKPIQSPQQQPQQQQQVQQPLQHQQVFIQQKQHPQQQQQLQQQYQQQVQSSQIQPKTIMANMTLQQQQQPGVVLGAERPIMPIVSVGGVGIGVAATSQINSVPPSTMSTMQQLPLPVYDLLITAMRNTPMFDMPMPKQCQEFAIDSDDFKYSTINPTIIGNQIVSGASQVQAMPIVNATQDQSPHDNANSAIMITSPDRNPPTECSLILPSTTNAVAATDEVKLAMKKEDVSATTEEVAAVPQSEATNGDQCKTVTVKEDEIIVAKAEEKQCNNPLAGLANAVNAITNGVVDESPTMPVSTPVTMNSKQAPPKAMVKPQVLTHVIEGFVIQEASEPFAVSQEATNILNRNTTTERETEEPPRKKHAPNYSNEEDTTSIQVNKCESCGNTIDEQNVRLKKEKRFCSSTCAKNKKRSETRDRDSVEKQWTDIETETKTVDNDVVKKNGEEKSLSTTTASSADESLPKVNPIKWTVGEVCDFIRGLPGCADYAEDFAIQEIDGQALMLLKEDHLMSAMSIKLGPALKIVARIDSMRTESMSGSNPMSNNLL